MIAFELIDKQQSARNMLAFLLYTNIRLSLKINVFNYKQLSLI